MIAPASRDAVGPDPSAPLSKTDRAGVLGARLEEAVVHERQRAMRALLQRPMLCSDKAHAPEFALVRRHAPWLREWLWRNAGWTLHVDSELARLRKTPCQLIDATRPALDSRTAQAFSRRRYVLLCLALAALERSDRQITLGRLADQIAHFSVSDSALTAAGMQLDLNNYDQRRDVVQVIRLLLELGVIVRVDGDEQQFIIHRGDVLYNVNRASLAAVLNVQRGPSTVQAESFEQRLTAIVEEPVPQTEEHRNRNLRTGLVRRLLDDPVLYSDDLDEEQRAYLTTQRGHLLRQIELATGLIPEIRAEGIAMVDDRGDATDLGLPEEGTDGHLTLLLAEMLAEHGRKAPGTAVGHAALQQHVAGLIALHRSHWRRDVCSAGAEVALTEQTLERLAALQLIRRTAEGVIPQPAIARYRLRESGLFAAFETTGAY